MNRPGSTATWGASPRLRLAKLKECVHGAQSTFGPRAGHESNNCVGGKGEPSSCVQALLEAGATGLEPATSGVTGRYAPTGYSRLRPGITGYSRHFLAEPTGCDRLRPAAARHSLCGMCVVAMVPVSTTLGCRSMSCQVSRSREGREQSYSGRPARPNASPSSAFLSAFAKRADRMAVATVRSGSISRSRCATALASSSRPRLARAAACST
jgi:hypothetical protein